MWDGYGKPPAKLVVETRSMVSTDSSVSVVVHEVNRPAGIAHQRDQLERAVFKAYPEAALSSAEDGIATFFTRTQMVVAYYDDASRARVNEEFTHGQAGAHVPF